MKKLTLVLALSIIVACGRKAQSLNGGFNSPEALIEYHLKCVANNDQKCFVDALLTHAEFKASVYPHLPEAKQKTGGISEEDFWGWTIPDRIKATRAVFARFGGAPLVKFNIEKPRKVLDLGPIRLLRDIPVYADFRNPEKKTVHAMITTDLFKAVVEVNGKYKLWNMTYE